MSINIRVTCSSCQGEGSRITGKDEEGQPIYEDPCTGCGGDGLTTTATLDDTLLNEINDKLPVNIPQAFSNLMDKVNSIEDKIDTILSWLDEH